MAETDPSSPVQEQKVSAVPATTFVSNRGDIERDLRSYQRWLVVLVALTIAAVCLLVSAGHGAKAGTRPWSPDSTLRVIVELLNFNYAYPTPRGNDVKWFAQGLGAAAALVTAGLIWHVRKGRRREDVLPGDVSERERSTPSARKPVLEQISVVGAAQIALLAFGAWSIYSYRWAHWPVAAMGEGVRNLIVIIWAVCLGRTMLRRSAMQAGIGLCAALTITSVVGLWYHFERNPFLRLEFPIGNPIFFAACMLPAIMLALAGLVGAVEVLIRGNSQPIKASKRSGAKISPAWILAGAVVVLGVVGWAFVLTHSRGPQVALVAGLAVAAAGVVMRLVPRDRRRLAGLGLVAIALAGALLVGRPWLSGQQSVAAGGRGASYRLRTYAWKYATDLFMSQPLAGHGQSSYLCLAQRMATLEPRDQWGRSDAEKDPTAFTSGLVGHAHNEWLEILAELGAAGFSMMVTALGLTFWAAWRAYMRADDPYEKWFVLALMATLASIIIEECADVALRMPVLPVVFYTIIGLLWACSAEPAKGPAEPEASTKKWLGPIGLAGSVLGAMVIVSLVHKDWNGALADGRVPELIEQQKWDEALKQAQAGSQNRLVLESLISAGLNGTEAAHAAAAARFEQFRSMLARQSAQSDRNRVRTLAEQDVKKFDEYASACLRLGGGFEKSRGSWQNVPGIHSVASYMADVLLMKSQLEQLKQNLGMTPDQAPFVQNARQWIELDYLRNRFDTAAALRLFGMSADMPVEYRIELLRRPLRLGPEPAGSIASIEAAVGQMLSKEPDAFEHSMEAFLQRAAPAAGQADPDRWPDPYAPETLRLKAIADRLRGRYEEAAALAERAVALYANQKISFYYPSAMACGLADLARSQFLASPDQPRKAAETCERAIKAWPVSGGNDDQLQTFRRDLSLYLLAAGDEKAASVLIRDQVTGRSEDQLKRNIGYGLAEICGMFIDREPQARPAAFRDWLARCLDYAPEYPRARWLAARVALQEGRTDEAIAHLKVAVAKADDDRQAVQMLQSLGEVFPKDAKLKSFIESQLSSQRNGDANSSSSAPATGAMDTEIPETRPN